MATDTLPIMTPVEPKSASDKAIHQGTVRDEFPRPCIVSIRDGEHDPGWLRRRFAGSLKVAGKAWSLPSIRHSMIRWSGLALLLLAAVVVVLGRSTTPLRAALGAALSFGWAGIGLAFIGVHLTGLRDSAGQNKNKLGLPNGLTLLRIVLIPAVAWAILAYERLEPHAVAATVIIFVVGFSDVLDGVIARWLRFETILGRNLDHLADVLICTSMAVAELAAGLMPGWLAGLVIFRYLGAGTGGILSVMYLPNVRIRPSLIGKACTAVVGLTLFLTIAQPLLASEQRANMVYLFSFSAALILVNIGMLIYMSIRGIAVERLGPADGGSKRP
jgi:cardiolipin synthase (CMP-forming)